MTECTCIGWHVYWWLGFLLSSSFWLIVIMIIRENAKSKSY